MVIDLVVRLLGLVLVLGLLSLFLLGWLNRRHFRDVEESYDAKDERLRLLDGYVRHSSERRVSIRSAQGEQPIRESIPNLRAFADLSEQMLHEWEAGGY